MRVFNPKPPSSTSARNTSAGNNAFGKDCSARWATNTMRGRCKIWPNPANVGHAAPTRRSVCRRGCSASAVCCRSNCPAYEPVTMVICGAFGTAGGANAMNSAIAFCRARPGNSAACARPIIRNAGWHSPRTGWRPATWFKNWNAGARRIRRTRGCPVHLREIFEVERDEFWSWHWTFRSARLPKPQPLLGDARVTDLAVNVILPWLWTRAVEGKNGKLQRVIEQRYFAWPPAQDNSVLRLARQRLLGPGRGRLCRSAAAQQGLMQIARDFCGHSNAVCEGCRFPELVGGWRMQTATQSPSWRMDCLRNRLVLVRTALTARRRDCSPVPARDRFRPRAGFLRVYCAAAG